MRINPLAIANQLCDFFTNGLLLVQPGLTHIEQCSPNQHVGGFLDSLDKCKSAIAMQCCANERCRPGMPVEQDIFPGDQNIVEDHHRVYFVKSVRQRIVLLRPTSGETGATDMDESFGIHRNDRTERIIRKFLIAPVRNGRFDEGLFCVGGRSLVLGAANYDARIGFLDDVQQHVRVLVLRSLGTVALGISVGGHMKYVSLDDVVNMIFDILGPLRVDLREHIAAIVQRPHLSDGLVADARDHATDFVEYRIDPLASQVPIFAGKRHF